MDTVAWICIVPPIYTIDLSFPPARYSEELGLPAIGSTKAKTRTKSRITFLTDMSSVHLL
jgi:hypothetical protein